MNIRYVTSLLSRLSLKKAWVPFTAKMFIVIQQSDMQCIDSQAENFHGAKTFLTEEAILPEFLSDNLSDVPIIFLVTVRVTAMFLCEREKLCAGKSTVTVKQVPRKVTVLQMWGQPRGLKKDITPNLGSLTGNSGVKQIPCDPEKCQE
jgi:hypothetical protein